MGVPPAKLHEKLRSARGMPPMVEVVFRTCLIRSKLGPCFHTTALGVPSPNLMMSRWVSFAFLAIVLHATVVAIDPMAVNNPAQRNLTDGAKAAGVVRAQILLGRAHFSCGEIDGTFGSNFQKALSAFQGERKLPVT